MKTILLSACVLIVISASAQNQQNNFTLPANTTIPHPDINYLGSIELPMNQPCGMPQQHNMTSLQSAETSADLSSRILGYRHDIHNAGSWYNTDSTKYSWTDLQGYDPNWGWENDEQTSYFYNSGNWEPTTQFCQTFNANDQVILYQNDDYTAGTWGGDNRSEYIWDSYNRYTQKTDYNWNSANMAWGSVWRYNYTYHGISGLSCDEYLVEKWVSGNWRNEYRYVYTYDANDKILTYVYQPWNVSEGDWDVYCEVTYTYSSNGKVSDVTIRQWISGAWVDTYQTAFEYEANDLLAMETYYYYDNADLIGLYQLSYTYDANNFKNSFIQYEWDSAGWVENFRFLYINDGEGYLISDTYQNWADSVWVNNFKSEYTYNSYDQLLTHYRSQWISEAWAFLYRDIYTYEEFGEEPPPPNTIAEVANDGMIVYPNPFTDQLLLRSNESAVEQTLLTIFDASGNEIYTAPFAGNTQLTTFNWSSGVYFYQIQTSDGISSGKLIKQ